VIDVPPEPLPSQEQVIEQRLIECGLDARGISVKYEDYLQSIEIVIGPGAGASVEIFDCIREAAGYEIVTFEDGQLQLAYAERSHELARPRLLAEARDGLAKRGLLEGFPERSDFSSDKLFAEAIERHCSVEPGSFFVEGQWGLVAQPKMGGDPLSQSEWDRMSCLMNALMYLSAKGESGFKIGFIGNERVAERDGQ
jgi:hypothetical protein